MLPPSCRRRVEIGLDAGLGIISYDDVSGVSIDGETFFDIPSHTMRVGFPAGDQFIVETRLEGSYWSSGDESETTFTILPGVNFLLGEMFYARGEVGLRRGSFDDGSFSDSATQYAFGGAVGVRNMIGSGAVLRAEVGVDRWLENEDDGLLAAWEIGIVVGGSLVIG